MKPTVGRAVHYSVGKNGDPRAAIITQCKNPHTELADDVVGLAIISPTGINFQPEVPYSADTSIPYTWSWPPIIAPPKPVLLGV